MEEIITEEQASQTKIKKPSHEPFFGVLVVMIITVLLVLLASYGGWFLYHGVKNSMSDKNLLSIENIPLAANGSGEGNKKEESKPAENKNVSSAPAAVNKQIAVKVLNGGASRGAAGVAADVLKAAGYTAVSTGNSTGNYSGVTVYFTAPAAENDANAIKEALLKKYPSSTVKPSIAGNADTNASAIMVVVGK